MLYLTSVMYILSLRENLGYGEIGLWVDIFANLGIYFLVWPAFRHGNLGKFYLKQYPNYIDFWIIKTLLCNLWCK